MYFDGSAGKQPSDQIQVSKIDLQMMAIPAMKELAGLIQDLRYDMAMQVRFGSRCLMRSRTSLVTEKNALIPAVKWKTFPLSPRGAFLIEQVFAFHSNA